MAINQNKFGNILVAQGLITQPQLDEAVKLSGSSGQFIGEILAKENPSIEEQVVQLLSMQSGLAYVDLATVIIEVKAIELITANICRSHRVLPLYITGNTLTIAMVNPFDEEALKQLKTLSALEIKPVLAVYSLLHSMLDKYYPIQQQQDTIQEKSPESLQEAAGLASVKDMVNNLIGKAVDMGASDIHLEPEKEKMACRFRVDGVLYPVSQIEEEYVSAVISRIKIMANIDIAERRLPQDGRIQMELANRPVDLRISTFPTVHGENVVIRILDRSGGILELKQLGFAQDTLDAFNQLIRRPYGIILVTGPTGSGKTTTLYGALSEVNTTEKNIITLEDPVEYEISNVRQAQVNVKAGLTFASGLRSIVRQDPDIIMIGEIRDKETADIAIHAALTGHLVFSTLHTNDAPSAAARLIDMGIEPFLVSSSVIAILAQRLIRTLCNDCKKEYTPSEELLKQLGIPADKYSNKPLKFYQETGCPKCKQRGYLGRCGIYELMLPNENIKELISRKSSAGILREEAIKNGMKSLRQAGLEKVIEGLTSVAEVLRVTEEI